MRNANLWILNITNLPVYDSLVSKAMQYFPVGKCFSMLLNQLISS